MGECGRSAGPRLRLRRRERKPADFKVEHFASQLFSVSPAWAGGLPVGQQSVSMSTTSGPRLVLTHACAIFFKLRSGPWKVGNLRCIWGGGPWPTLPPGPLGSQSGPAGKKDTYLLSSNVVDTFLLPGPMYRSGLVARTRRDEFPDLHVVVGVGRAGGRALAGHPLARGLGTPADQRLAHAGPLVELAERRCGPEE